MYKVPLNRHVKCKYEEASADGVTFHCFSLHTHTHMHCGSSVRDLSYLQLHLEQITHAHVKHVGQ